MDNNSFPDLCEFSVRFEKNAEDEAIRDCFVDLRVMAGEVVLGDYDCSIEFERLFVSVDQEGMSLVTGSLYGDPKKPNEVSRTSSARDSVRKKKSVAGLVDISKLGVGVAAKAEASTANEQQIETSVEDADCDLRVKARPNLRWEIREPTGGALDATYLANDRLFSSTRRVDRNRQVSALELKVKQRDLKINPISGNARSEQRFARMSTNQRRLLDIFIAKSLSETNHSKKSYKGEVIVSRSEHHHEE